MEETIKNKIEYFDNFFSYFKINEENFSKNVQTLIKILKPKLKYSENELTVLEKEKLIFFLNKKNDLSLNIKKNYYKDFNFLIDLLKNLNLNLQLEKDNLNKTYENEKINLKKQYNPTINIDSLEYIQNNNNNNNVYSSDEIIFLINKVRDEKMKIEELYKKKLELEQDIFELEKIKNNYNNLPADLEQIKKLVLIKKEEYQNLKQNKKI